MKELIAEVEAVQKAEAAAMWQARAEFLASQLEQAQLSLAAPKEPTSQERPFSDDSKFDSTQTPSAHRNGRPRAWWRWW